MRSPRGRRRAATVSYYDDNAAEFASRTLSIDLGHLRAPLLKELAPASRILDLGCGVGRDARAFLAAGHSVTAVDASREMVRIATENTGQPAQQMRFDEMEFEEEYDGVWACASLLHAPKDEMPDILARVARSLRACGVAQLSVKYGDGEEYRDGRWFSDYTVAGLHAVLDAVATLTPAKYWVTQDQRRTDTQWVHALARRT